MKFDDIKNEYKSDIIDDLNAVNIDELCLMIPKLHQKYSIFLSNESLILDELEIKKRILVRQKWEYYTGKMADEDLKALGWEPFQLRILKSDVDKYIYSDKDITKIDTQISFQKQKVSFIDRALKEIMSRQWVLKITLEHRKFMSGG